MVDERSRIKSTNVFLSPIVPFSSSPVSSKGRPLDQVDL